MPSPLPLLEPTLAQAAADPRAAYVHVPFCIHRCGYCDFTVIAGRDDLIPSYLDALERELATLGTPREIDTLFVGGGTPTQLSPGELSRLLNMLRKWFPLAPGYEFSVEANPAGLDAAKVDVLVAGGVNRVSLGVQSFDSSVLSTLERDHRRPEIPAAIAHVRRRIENVSLDLIFGVPGQSLATWRETLREAIELDPAHTSTYGLTYEQGTAFWGRRRKGQLVPAPEDLERDMYALAMDELAAAGYEQYELSNFARPGRACRHNQTYWQGRPYYGFGPGAARYINGSRETNHRSVTTWLRRVLAGRSPTAERETLSPEDRARELLVLGLRTNAGIDTAAFQERTGFTLETLAADVLRKHREAGLLEHSGTHLRLTRGGRFVADSIVVDLL
jgi:oxygen-independent coproporphyrinogen-3 oxidase